MKIFKIKGRITFFAKNAKFLMIASHFGLLRLLKMVEFASLDLPQVWKDDLMLTTTLHVNHSCFRKKEQFMSKPQKTKVLCQQLISNRMTVFRVFLSMDSCCSKEYFMLLFILYTTILIFNKCKQGITICCIPTLPLQMIRWISLARL